jgi:hypothetical protein
LRSVLGDSGPLNATPWPGATDFDDQDRVLERGERTRAVTRALRRDAKAFLARKIHDGDHVGVGQRHRHDGGALIDGEVPCAPRLVPAFVVRSEHVAVEAGTECFDVDRGGGP